MTKDRKKWWLIPAVIAFLIYIFVTAQSIPEETILIPRWISSLESNFPVNLREFSPDMEKAPIPFILGRRYGYLGEDGRFLINQLRNNYVSISENLWAEYENMPSSIQVMNVKNEAAFTIEDVKGYPFFRENRAFIIGNEQNSLSAIGPGGEELWTHDFPAPITCIDTTQDFVLVGTLDGTVELLNFSGSPVFTPFEPGGSRLSVILGCAISRDASRLAIISGVDEQRFLLLERSGSNYRIIYHEFLGVGFRRDVQISFVDNDHKVAFERQGGLGIYDINSRTSTNLPLKGEVLILDDSGEDRFLYVISSQGPTEKRFISIRYPASIIIDVPFRSENVFFVRRDSNLFLGGDLSIASFEIGRK